MRATCPGRPSWTSSRSCPTPRARCASPCPGPDRLAAALGRAGVGPGTFVVIYCRSHNTMAARLWWMLRAIGFDDAAVLNGGWKKWTSEGRPVTTEATVVSARDPGRAPAPGCLRGQGGRARPRSTIRETLLVNALSREQHEGKGGIHYGRPGHIPGSHCVPARELTDPATQAYLPPERMREMFRDGRRARREEPAPRHHLLRRRDRRQQRRLDPHPARRPRRRRLRQLALGVGSRPEPAHGAVTQCDPHRPVGGVGARRRSAPPDIQ